MSVLRTFTYIPNARTGTTQHGTPGYIIWAQRKTFSKTYIFIFPSRFLRYFVVNGILLCIYNISNPFSISFLSIATIPASSNIISSFIRLNNEFRKNIFFPVFSGVFKYNKIFCDKIKEKTEFLWFFMLHRIVIRRCVHTMCMQIFENVQIWWLTTYIRHESILWR